MKRSFFCIKNSRGSVFQLKCLFFHYHSSISPHNKKIFYRKTYPYFFHINTSILYIFLPLLAQPITTSLHFNSNIHYTLLQGRKDIKIFLFPIFPFFYIYIIFLSTHGCITIICHQSLDQNQFCLTFFFYLYIQKVGNINSYNDMF